MPTSSPAMLAAALALALGGCGLFSAPEVQRGHRIDPAQLAQLTPGVQTRTDVQALLGSPSQSSTFGDASWYYISARTRQRPGRRLALGDQQTVAVDFDPRGVLTRVRVVNEDATQTIDPVARATPVPGNDRTLMQALFGNVGRIGPGGLGETAGPGPAAQIPNTR